MKTKEQTKNENNKNKWILISVCYLFVATMLVLPLIYIIMTALGEGMGAYWRAVKDGYTIKSALLTGKVTLITVTVNTIFGIFAAWLIFFFSFQGKKLVQALIDLPLTISPVIVGLIFLLTFGRQSLLYSILQKCGIFVIFAVLGIVLVTIFVTFPLIYREIITVLHTRGVEEEEAAALLGAGGFEIFLRVTFPHIKWALLYGIVLCSARAMGEFGAVSVISGHLQGKTNTLPLTVELLYQGYDFTGAFAVSSILVVMAVVLLIMKECVAGKRQSSGKTPAYRLLKTKTRRGKSA